MTSANKVLENKLRRIASRRGYRLEKSRTRDPKALNFDRWTIELTDGGIGVPEVHGRNLTLSEVEEFFK
jgi:hypothetical protein